MRYFVFLSLYLLSLNITKAEILDQGNSSVVIGNKFVTGVIGVALKQDGSVMVGTDEKMLQFKLSEIPEEFLISWNLDPEIAYERSRLNSVALENIEKMEMLRQKEMVEDVNFSYPSLKFPLIAKKDILEYKTSIKKGEKFTLIPYKNELGEFYLRVVVLKTDGTLLVGQKKRGLTPANKKKIALDLTSLDENVSSHLLVKENFAATRTIHTYPRGTYHSEQRPYTFNKYYIESNPYNDGKESSYVVCYLESIIGNTFHINPNQRIYCGDDDRYTFGKKAYGKVFLIFSSNGTVGYYKVPSL